MRRILAVISSAVLMFGLGIGVTPSASAADLGTVTVAGAQSPFTLSTSSLVAQIGDTFSITNSAGNSGTFVSVRGSVTRTRLSTNCAATSPYCTLVNGDTDTYTINELGNLEIYVYLGGSLGPLIGTVTLGSAGAVGVTDPALVYPTATIDANGGTCVGPTQYIKASGQNAAGGTFTTPTSATCMRTNYSLAGWARSATATTSAFAPGSTVPIGLESFTLFAVWVPRGVEIRYNANVGSADQCIQGGSNVGGDNRQSAATVLPAGGAVATQAPCTPIDAQLVGWALTGNGPSVVAPGAALPASLGQGTSHVLYAKWQVAYGVTSSSQEVVVGAGESVAVTFTATINNSPASGRSVDVKGDGAAIAVSSGETPTSRVTATTSTNGQVTVLVKLTGTGPGTVTASFGDASVKLAVAPASVEKSITIIGSRTTVSGKAGISIEGTTTGFKKGDTVVPYIRFPGETTFTAGSARPDMGADGSFSWSRKTGKKVYVYVTNEDGSVKSNRVIIAAN